MVRGKKKQKHMNGRGSKTKEKPWLSWRWGREWDLWENRREEKETVLFDVHSIPLRLQRIYICVYRKGIYRSEREKIWVMRIRKNAKLSPLLFSSSCTVEGGSVPVETHVCQLNQSPWDVIPFQYDSFQVSYFLFQSLPSIPFPPFSLSV